MSAKHLSYLCRSPLVPGPSFVLTLMALALLAGAGTIAAQDLSRFLDQLSTVSSVHLEAEVAISIETPDGPLLGSGAFSFWEQGDLFKIRCETEGIEGLMDDVEWAYDGEESLLWLLKSNTLTENNSLTAEAPTALPNPFFLPVEFLSRRQICPTCRASLDQVIQERPLLTELHRAIGKSTVDTSTVGEPGERQATLVVAKSETGPRYTVSLTRRQGMWAPVTIRHTSPDTGEELLIELEDYQREPALLFPRSITVETKDPLGHASARMTFRVKILEVNDSLAPETFRIRGNEHTTVLRREEIERLEEQLEQ